jgi:hypothetical protein
LSHDGVNNFLNAFLVGFIVFYLLGYQQAGLSLFIINPINDVFNSPNPFFTWNTIRVSKCQPPPLFGVPKKTNEKN